MLFIRREASFTNEFNEQSNSDVSVENNAVNTGETNTSRPSAADVDFGRTVVVQVFEWLDVLVTALIAVVIIFSLIFRVATIDGTSMESTLHGGEKVIITNVGYEPQRGDVVVVYRENDKPIIKRVIAVAGETVEIRPDGNVYIDGTKL